MNESYVKATSDVFIKYLFGKDSVQSNALLLSFINAVLEDSGFSLISKVVQKNPFNYKEFENDKLSILDIKVEDEKGRVFNVEVQSTGDGLFHHRTLYYWAKLYISKLTNGDDYEKLLPTVTINVLDFVLFDELAEYHSTFMLKESGHSDYILTDHLILHFLELPKLVGSDFSRKIDRWLVYLKQEGHMNEILKKLIEEDDDIRKAHEIYEEFNSDQQLRWLAIDREKAMRDKIYYQRIAEKKGLERGLAEGRAEGRAEGEELGWIRGKQNALERLVSLKFKLTDEMKTEIEKQDDPEILDRALEEIMTADSVALIKEILRA